MTDHRRPPVHLSKRALAATLAALQIVPASLLSALAPQLAHAQQSSATSYGYDAQGNLTSSTDPNGKLHRADSRCTQPHHHAEPAAACDKWGIYHHRRIWMI